MPGADMEDDPLAGLDFEVDEPTDIINVKLMSNFDIADRIDEITQELFKMGQALKPEGEAGRKLHSQRAALIVEQNVRKEKRG